ncbi:MAG TPA: hypothetical protein VGU20_31030 [Stellaceae bacterium]|nr:hypothetical protein [Terriglobia bacterium]HEV2551785.1 hypothetical protein [Stellaceae bacterium]
MAGNILDVDGLAAQYDAQNQAYAKQAAATAQARQAQEQAVKQPPTLATVGTQDRGHVTPGIIDSVLNEVGQWGTAARHVGQDVMAGAATAAGNAMDAAKAAGSPADPNDPANAPAPVWDHAREAIGDFRDAMVVQDPTGVDPVIQAGAQLALPFAAYSKALSALHGISNIVVSGAATDLTALAPHDMRTADLIRLGETTDTKIGAALRAIGPYGLNAYINYLADRTNETEAQGRFKNALDGLGANLILTPLLHAAGIVVKQGVAATRYAVENGIRNTVSDLAGSIKVGPAAERGSIGVQNNASGESAASLEAQNRPKRNLDIVDPDGNGQPILKDVTQVDQQAPKGHLIIDRDTGEIVSRGPDMNLAGARGLRARYEAKMFSEEK